MSESDSHSAHRSSRQQQSPPVTTLPSIPQLPPISLATSPSVESFTTALSSASRDSNSQQKSTSVTDGFARFSPPASPSAAFYPAAPTNPHQVRAASSVQHLRSYRDVEPRMQPEFSDISDFEPAANVDNTVSFDERNRATPVPANYKRFPTTYTSDVERRMYVSRRWDSERDEPYNSTASTSRGGTMSDSHAHLPISRSLSSKPSSSAIHQSANRLHALSTASNNSISSSGSSFFGGNVRSPSSPRTRRDGTPVPPMAPAPPPTKPLPSPNPPARSVGRARSASLLGMVSTAAHVAEPSKEKGPIPRGSSTLQGLPKPRLTLRPAPTSSSSSPSTPLLPEFTILVIGSPQCGKSLLISKGLKSWGLEKERPIILGEYQTNLELPAALAASLSGASSSSTIPSGGKVTRTITHEVRAVSRIAHVAIKNSTYPIEVIEVASQELLLCGAAWPALVANGHWVSGQNVAAGVQAGVNNVATGDWASTNGKRSTGLSPRGRVVDGLVVCYDSSDHESWEIAKSLLSHASQAYINQPIQAIVVACKTDLLNPPVPADHTKYHPILSGQSAEADQYQIGISDPHWTQGHRRQVSSDEGHSSFGNNDAESSRKAGVNPVHKNLGLVPVARTEGTGKKKMRDSFNWLLRRVERAKRHHRANMMAAAAAIQAQSQAQPQPQTQAQALARTPTPTPPSTTRSPVDGPQTFWPAPVVGSTPPTTQPLSVLHSTSVPPNSSTPPLAASAAAPMSPLSPLSSASAGLRLSFSQPGHQSSGTSSKSPRSPTSPSRARSTSDLTSDYARGSREREKEEREREYIAKGLAARAQASAAAVAAASGVGSGTERSSSSIMGKKTSASMANLQARVRADSLGASLSGPPLPSPAAIPSHVAVATASPSPSATAPGSVGKGSVSGSAKGVGPTNGASNAGTTAGLDGAGTAPLDGGGSRRGSENPPDGPGASIDVSILPMKTPKDPPPLQYATLDELLDKVVFLAITDEDPVFVEQFLLVFRRFATPRSLLLGLQKRMRELSATPDDMLLARFSQMRICSLLEEWMRTYPGDFAASGAEPALQALVRQILSNFHTAHYGAEFMPFLQIVPELTDEERAWALKEDSRRDTDDGTSDLDLDADDPEAEALELARTVSVSIAVSMGAEKSTDSLHRVNGNGGRVPSGQTSSRPPQSIPMGGLKPKANPSISSSSKQSAQTPLFGEYHPTKGLRGPDVLPGTKPNMKELLKASVALCHQPPHFVAEEITRLEVPLFLAVQPRDWLRHGLGKKVEEGFPHSIQRIAKFFNYLTMWTASLILVHDKARTRAKTIEFFIKVANALRKLNNYSGLRAVVTGIITSRTDLDDDPVMALIKDRTSWKKEFKSLETLLGASRMHSAYRMALKNTHDAAILSMEVHTYDLIRADDSNPDYKPGDETQIHWGKFALMAKMILNVVMYQRRFNDTTAFTFPERSDIRELVMNVIIMDESTLYSRVSLPADFASSGPLSDTGGSASRFRQIFARK
ncbi:hypothetical protein FRB99_006349 [Tulasnella sp. 403]|nr:hypothetical protein FRB99_006349 [Tulasnella sp. 403]